MSEPRKKVFIIDDEVDLCFLMKSILEQFGQFEVRTFSSGAEGLKACEEDPPDLLFLDFVMPGMKGNQILERLRAQEKTRAIPVILTSGLGESVYFKNGQNVKWEPFKSHPVAKGSLPSDPGWEMIPGEVAREFGVRAFLPKPFNSNTLVSVALAVLG